VLLLSWSRRSYGPKGRESASFIPFAANAQADRGDGSELALGSALTVERWVHELHGRIDSVRVKGDGARIVSPLELSLLSLSAASC
jgi:hypothetical protein